MNSLFSQNFIDTFKNYIKKITNYYILIQNLNLNFNTDQKKALIVYIDTPFKLNDLEEIYSSNVLEMEIIVKYFIDHNYLIDIIDVKDINNVEKISNKKYDVIFGFGDIFYSLSKNNPKAKKIMYVTENHPDFSFEKEKERIEYFNKRHRKKVKIKRSGMYYKKEHFLATDYFIAMGRKEELIKLNKEIYDINPSGLINKKYIFKEKNHEVTKYNFLWFGSNGAIHKGLDLLIDIFSKREDINLHICGLNKKDKKLLKIPNKKNIKEYGRINVNSELFLNLVDQCSFIILPSCSEAMSTSILTGMLHGLIPIVNRNSGGLDKLTNKAFFLDDYKIDYIERKINDFIKLDDNILEKMQYEVFKYSRDNFTLMNYKNNFYKIMDHILC